MRVTFGRLFVAAAFVAAPMAAIAAPVPIVPAKADGPMATARKALDEVGDMNYRDRTLNDVLNDLKEKSRVSVVLDNGVLNFGLDPNQPVVTVNLKQVKLREGLKAALAPYNLKFGLTREGLYISTEEGVITAQLRQRVTIDCDGTDFAISIRQLADETGANVVVDPRLGEKAKAAVTLKLEDVPLETAVRLMAEVVDLRAVRMNNVLFVTTPEKAKALREDADGPTRPLPVNPVFPFSDGGGILPVPGVIGGFGGFGGVQVAPAVEAVPDKPVAAPPQPAPVPQAPPAPASGTTAPAAPATPPPPPPSR